MSRVLVFTHGAKDDGADPKLTDQGRHQIEGLTELLPEQRRVFCGTARRHLDTAAALGVFEEIEWYDPMLGDPSSGVPDGQGGWDIALACGARTSLDKFRMPSREAMLVHLRETYGTLLQDNNGPDIVFVAGRPILEALKLEAASAAVYELDLVDGIATRVLPPAKV